MSVSVLDDADIDRLADRIADRCTPRLLERLFERMVAAMPAEPLVTKGELASRWRVSEVTIDRMARDGMPIERITGDAPRFNVAACDLWRRSRPVPPPKASKVRSKVAESLMPTEEMDEVDMSGVRRVSGAGRRGRVPCRES